MILVGDVGGTRTRLALAERLYDGWRITGVEERRTAPDLVAAVADYVRSSAGGSVEAAAFGGAGTLAEDGSIQLTNADVQLAPAALGAAAGVGRAVVVNDFGAIAESIPHLPAEGLLPLGRGGARIAGMPVAVLGPGTGLGVALGTPARGGWAVIAGDGGHAELAPVDDEELAVRASSGSTRRSAATAPT
jgi:glucokinase